MEVTTKTRTQVLVIQASKVNLEEEAAVAITTAVVSWIPIKIISLEVATIMLLNSMHLSKMMGTTEEVVEVVVVEAMLVITKALETAMRSTLSKTTQWTLAHPKHSVHQPRLKVSCQPTWESVL